MHILHYLDEIRPADEIPELKDMQKVSPDSKELSLGKLLVENLSSEHLDLSKYSNAYTKGLEKLIDSKETQNHIRETSREGSTNSRPCGSSKG